MRLLMEHPDQLQMLVDNPALIPAAVEEMLRYNPAFIGMRRTVMEDTELGGQQLKKGDKLIVLEAMKMQTTIYAPVSGLVSELAVQVGDAVESKDLLLKMREG